MLKSVKRVARPSHYRPSGLLLLLIPALCLYIVMTMLSRLGSRPGTNILQSSGENARFMRQTIRETLEIAPNSNPQALAQYLRGTLERAYPELRLSVITWDVRSSESDVFTQGDRLGAWVRDQDLCNTESAEIPHACLAKGSALTFQQLVNGRHIAGAVLYQPHQEPYLEEADILAFHAPFRQAVGTCAQNARQRAGPVNAETVAACIAGHFSTLDTHEGPRAVVVTSGGGSASSYMLVDSVTIDVYSAYSTVPRKLPLRLFVQPPAPSSIY